METIPPIAGEVRAVVRAAQQVSIHGDVYYDLELVLEAPEGAIVRVRAPAHACVHPPVAGERVSVRLLMQQVVAVESCA